MKTSAFVYRPKLAEFAATLGRLFRLHRRQRTFIPALERLEDRTTPSHVTRAGLDADLEGIFHNLFDDLLGDRHEPAPPPAGGGSGLHGPEVGGGGGGGGGAGQGDSGTMGGGAGGNQFANAGAATGGGGRAGNGPAQPSSVPAAPVHNSTPAHHAAGTGTGAPKPAKAADQLAPASQAATTTAQATSGPFTAQGVTYGAAVGSYNDVVGTFTYATAAAVPADFFATIAWGDGTSSTGLVQGQDGQFAVTGMHTFTSSGTFTPKVTVQNLAGTTVNFTSTLFVGQAANPADNPNVPTLLAQDPTVNAVEGASFSGALGSFTCSPFRNPCHFSTIKG